jgi:type II secretory ATPase GspE/PulE/Tfp pilus assembly ATPase PilB-like protein
MLVVLKQLAGTNYQDRRSKQTGHFKTEYLRSKQSFEIVSQGVHSGERVALYLSYKRPPMETLEDLGIRASMVQQIVQLMKMEGSGMFLVSAIPGEGYTSAWRAALDSCDRLVKDFFVIEAGSHQRQLRSVPQRPRRNGDDAAATVAASRA